MSTTQRRRCVYCGNLDYLAKHVPNGGVIPTPNNSAWQCVADKACHRRHRQRMAHPEWGWGRLRAKEVWSVQASS